MAHPAPPRDDDDTWHMAACLLGDGGLRVPVYSAITSVPNLRPVRVVQEWKVEQSLVHAGAVAMTLTDAQGAAHGFFLSAADVGDLIGALAQLQA